MQTDPLEARFSKYLLKNDAVRSEIKMQQTEGVRSKIKKPEAESMQSEIKKPQNEAVRSKMKNSEFATRKFEKLKPNYFVAIQISDTQIMNALCELQQHILDKDKFFIEGMKQLTTLHITLMVMHIGDAETYARALNALQNIHKEHDDDLSKNPVKLEFKGLGHFNKKVLYAKLSEDDSYKRLISLAESVREHYATASIFTTDSRKRKYNPHLTVLDVQDAWKKKELPNIIDPALYKDFDDQYFGSQEVQNIQLLSMADSRDEFGYYLGETLYFSAFQPKVQRGYGNKMFETEEVKKGQCDCSNEIFETEESRKDQHDYCNKILETEETKKSIIQMINSLMK